MTIAKYSGYSPKVKIRIFALFLIALYIILGPLLPVPISSMICETSKSPTAPSTDLPIIELPQTEPPEADEGHAINITTSFLTGNRVAVIIEDRPLPNLIPLMLHFSSVLGPSWPVVLFTSMEIQSNSTPLRRAMDEKRIFIKLLPSDVHFYSHAVVSAFLTKPWIWDQLAPADHVLLFQTDSILCSNAPQTVDDFVHYDLIGAPIDSSHGHGYNGGLSLRNRNMILEIVNTFNFDFETLEEGGGVEVEFEDQWFYKKMTELAPKSDGTPRANLPREEIAMTFAVETIYYSSPLGYHQPRRWQEQNMDKIEEWCPEIRLCTGGRL